MVKLENMTNFLLAFLAHIWLAKFKLVAKFKLCMFVNVCTFGGMSIYLHDSRKGLKYLLSIMHNILHLEHLVTSDMKV